MLGFHGEEASPRKQNSELSWQDCVGREPTNAGQRADGERSKRLKG